MRDAVNFTVKLWRSEAFYRSIHSILSYRWDFDRRWDGYKLRAVIPHAHDHVTAAVIGDGNSGLGKDRLVIRLGKIEPTFVFRSQVLARLGNKRAKFINGWHESLPKVFRL
jgi:hypothetical protein